MNHKERKREMKKRPKRICKILSRSSFPYVVNRLVKRMRRLQQNTPESVQLTVQESKSMD
jgi:hypothetical protein